MVHAAPETATSSRMVAAAQVDLRTKIAMARRVLLRMHFEAGVGHVGGNLSCIDALIVLFEQIMREQDHFILSKGHSAGALYVALASVGKLPEEQLDSFHRDNTLLAGHPPSSGLFGIQFGTGSLGHGLSLANGVALASRFTGVDNRVFCLLSDGEWQEGSTWEALVFAVHQRLANLTLMIDQNGLQGFGTTDEVASLGSLAERLIAFGMACHEIDGHDPDQLAAALQEEPRNGPRAILMRTVKGRGVASLAGTLESHYLPLTRQAYDDALREFAIDA